MRTIKIIATLMIISALLFAGIGCTSTPADNANTDNDQQDTEQNYNNNNNNNYDSEPENTGVCKWDWKGMRYEQIGEYQTAPPGKEYFVATIYIQNNDDTAISTNPWNWELIADGIRYQHSSVTYSPSINSQSVEVEKGGTIETQIVFEVPDGTSKATLEYTGIVKPDMQTINYYN